MSVITKKRLSPILKWVGGKRQLLKEIIPLIPDDFLTYHEPFIGGGAVLLELQPKRAVINDYNSELINVYNVIKSNSKDLLTILKEHEVMNSEEYFYKIRSLDRNNNYNLMSDVERAGRIIYLNKTCYNGLFRVNSSGQFNSPYGRYKKPNIVNEEAVLLLSEYFNNNKINIICGDYRKALSLCKAGDFVYLDPPYMPISSSSSFTGYTENGFDVSEQLTLKEECDKLNEKGVKFMLSNSDHELIKEIYVDYNIKIIKAKRVINSNAKKRGEINEVLIRNYE